MLRGLYTAASGMIANLVATDTLANNLANVNTTAFKKNGVSFQAFPEMLIQRVTAQAASNPVVGSLINGAKIAATAIDFSQGTLQRTGNPLDLALEGDGFFTVKNPAGELLYTRNGSFTINQQGLITTLEGNVLQGDQGAIQVPPGTADIHISQSGQIVSGQQVLGRLTVAHFGNNQALQKAGGSLFKATPQAQLLPPGSANAKPFKVQQGMLEGSNTNAVSELVNSITGLRLYEALQKNIQMHNETLGKAVNELGRVKA